MGVQGSLSKHIYIGRAVSSIETFQEFLPISKVILTRNDDTWFESGNDSGRTIEITNPWATQQMADHILSNLYGYVYKPYDATDAIVPIDMEIGDAVTITGIYGIVADASIQYNRLITADISAPEDEEIDHEYPFETRQQREYNRETKKIYSLISKTDEEIRLLVTDEVNNLQSEISQKVDNVSISVSNGETSSLIKLTVDGAEVSSQEIKMNGLVTFEGLQTGTTIIDGACIQTGQISADRINLTGSISWGELSQPLIQDINSIYNTAQSANSAAMSTQSFVDGWRYTGTTYIDGTKLMTGTVMASSLQGGEVLLLDNNMMQAASFTLSGASSFPGRKLVINSGAVEIGAMYGSVYISGGFSAYLDIKNLISCGGDVVPSGSQYSLGSNEYKWANLYCLNGTIITSDRTKKTEINYDIDKYDNLFDALYPCSYRLIDGTRTHLGLISQDVEEAMQKNGISSNDFAGFVKDDAGYALRYTEFIPLLISQIQKIKKKIIKLEEKNEN